MTDIIVECLFPKQNEFVNSTHRHTLFSGAVRGGKTEALIYRAFNLIYNKDGLPTTGLIGAFTYPMIRDIIKPKLFKLLRKLPTTCRWEFRKSDNDLVFHLKNGDTTVHLRHLENEGSVQGLDLHWYCIDEATVGIDEETFDQLNARLSFKGMAFGSVACNPGNLNHFIYKFYFQCKETERPFRKIIRAFTTDNRFLSEDYLRDLSTKPERWRKRFMEGEWGVQSGAVYNTFYHETHIQPFEVDPAWRMYLSIDLGFTNPFCALLCAVDSDDNIYIVEEHYKEKMLIEEHITVIEERFIHKYPIQGIIMDHAPAERLKLSNHFVIPTIFAKKNVREGIEAVQQYLEVTRITGKGLLVHPRCENLIDEFGDYQWEPASELRNMKEEPRKFHDHALDALRYFVMEIKNGKR